MKDDDCVRFLQWCLPQLHMRWQGFRKVRSQVCKRIDRRITELGLEEVDDYRSLLEEDADEWKQLDELCRVTISRFYRDHKVFERIANDVLPALAAPSTPVRCWSAGCASGEEPYTLAICGREIGVDILATDADEHMLHRARVGCYQRGTLKELPDELFETAFEFTRREDEPYCLKKPFREAVTFRRHDVRDEPPYGLFDLILCRNLVFMYFDEKRQRECLNRFVAALRAGAALVIGAHEELPDHGELEPWFVNEGIFRRRADADSLS